MAKNNVIKISNWIFLFGLIGLIISIWLTQWSIAWKIMWTSVIFLFVSWVEIGYEKDMRLKK